MSALDDLVSQIARLPGLGRKSAVRIAHYLLKSDRRIAGNLAEVLATLHDRIHPCSECGRYTEADPCSVCSDSGRDRTVICIVEQPQDSEVLEQSGEFHGLYHILGGVLSPIDGVGPGELRIASLYRRIDQLGVREVILATNPTVEGDTTALYLVRQLQSRGVACSRLALGLPVGGDLEYADRLTVARSLRGRTHYES
ncbi:MAG: recombination mediator RecR [Spirochaetaceae bacterium]